MRTLCIVVLPALLCPSFQSVCNDYFPEVPEYETNCVLGEQDKENVACELDPNVTWSVVDSKKGKVAVELKLPHRNCTSSSYTLELRNCNVTIPSYNYVTTVSEKSRCGLVSVPSGWSRNSDSTVHSRRTVTLYSAQPKNSTALPRCGQSVRVVFSYVFSGCYSLIIFPKYRHQNAMAASPKWITTEYVVDPLGKPVLANQYIQASRTWLFSYCDPNELNVAQVEFETRVCKHEPCVCGSGSKQHWWRVAFSLSGHLMCKIKTSPGNPLVCESESDHQMRCTFHNLTAGLYCVMVMFLDDRSTKRTLWNKNRPYVYYTSFVNITDEVKNTSVLPTRLPSVPILAISLSVLAVVCVLLLAVFVMLWRRRRIRYPEPVNQLGITLQSHKPQILLLYARDCKPFMVFMETLRDVLKETTQCEVMDCFDLELAEEISRNKTDWLRLRLTSSAVKVVIVESKCAGLHEEALRTGRRVCYAEPQWLDDLFVYSLKTLSDQLETNTYERVHVAWISAFSDAERSLSHVTPYTRYELPRHLDTLVTSLYRQSTLEYATCIDSGMLKLLECLKTLHNYNTANPDYLATLLGESVEV